VERVEDAYYYGFSLSGDGRYLLDDFTVTHNSGKTSWPAALARDRRVIALSHTKMLQQDNYGGTYDFTFLFGKGNYPCALNPGTTAALCKHAGDPKLCGRYPCAYYRQKNAAMLAARCALNYAYFMTANWPREQAPSGYLVLDECHLLPDLVIEHSSVTVDERTRREWDLPAFPLLTTKGSSLMAMGATKPVDQAKSWLARAKAVMTPKVEALEKRVLSSRGEDVLKAYNKAVELMWSLDTTGRALMQSPDDWFIRSGPGAIELSGDRKVGGFFCKPLTARHHFPSMFLLGGPTILMSATIGNFETFSTELGIQNYRALTVPSQWGPRSRPVYYFEDAPSIGRKTVERDWDKQAELISKMLHAVPTNWAGVIHCTSKAQTYALANRLAHNGLERRIWVPPSTGTNQQLAAWEQAKRDYSGRIAVAWSWWVGVDLLDEKIDILAKTPYPFIGDDYSQARLHFDGSFYLQQTAWQLMQGCGRTRRGRPQDYDRDGQRAGLVAIVDQNWKRVRKYFDADFAESMTAWK
jgi:Rad3-related DNA helicase